MICWVYSFEIRMINMPNDLLKTFKTRTNKWEKRLLKLGKQKF
jgi:hypothetical protein